MKTIKTPEEILAKWGLDFHYQNGNWTHNLVIGAMREFAQQQLRKTLQKFIKYAEKSPHLLLDDVLEDYLRLTK